MVSSYMLLGILCFLSSQVDSAVLGIDFGNSFMKVALVAPGHPFKIALDISSKRKLATIVGFDDGERRFGNGARSLITKRPQALFS